MAAESTREGSSTTNIITMTREEFQTSINERQMLELQWLVDQISKRRGYRATSNETKIMNMHNRLELELQTVERKHVAPPRGTHPKRFKQSEMC